MEQKEFLTAEAEVKKDQAVSDPLTAEDECDIDKIMSDSDDSDSEDEAQQNLLLETLQTELVANPSNYDAHLQVISSSTQLNSIILFFPLF